MLRILTASILFIAALGTAQAGLITAVSIDTSGLVGQGTFYADFQFTSPNGNNTVTISRFSFDSALTEVLPSQAGSFFSEILIPFTPAPVLTFQVNFDTNPLVVKFPDQLSFYLLDAQQNPLPTADPLGTNSLMTVNLTADGPVVSVYEGAGDLLQATPVATAVPEPGMSGLLGGLLIGGVLAVRRRWVGGGR